jgi:hypothetical protein
MSLAHSVVAEEEEEVEWGEEGEIQNGGLAFLKPRKSPSAAEIS